MANIDSRLNLHRRARGLSVTVGVLLLAAAGTAGAGDLDICKAKCPATPPLPPSWTTNKGYVQCVEYAKYRAGMKDHTGDGWTYGDYPACVGPNGATHCVQEQAQPGTVLVSAAYENGTDAAGHVAIVECVWGDWAQLSEYNVEIPGGYGGHHCVNVKAARDMGTPYKFLRPFGKTIAVGQRCDDPIKINKVAVQPGANVENGTVAIDLLAPTCGRAKYTLHREVFGFVGGVKQKLADHSKSTPIADVLATHKDSFAGVPPCSEFVYRLEMVDYPPNTPVNQPKIKTTAPVSGVNLSEVEELGVQLDDILYGEVDVRWRHACPDYKGAGAIQYQVGYTRGDGGTPLPVVVPGKPIVVGKQTREHPVTKLFDATTYTVNVRSYLAGSVSAKGSEHTFTTKKAAKSTKTAVPQRPQLTADCKAGKLVATWPETAGVTEYALEVTAPVKKPAVPTAKVVPVLGTTTYVIDAPLEGNYSVKLQSVVGGQRSAWTLPVAQARDCVAEPPIMLPLTNDPCTGVKLAWDLPPEATVANLQRFEVVRTTVESGASLIVGSAGPAMRSYVDAGAPADKSYRYHLRAVYRTPEGQVLFSKDSAIAGPVQPASPPRSPELTSVAIEGDRVRLRFTDRAVNETGFVVKRWAENEAGALVTYQLPARAGTGQVMWDEPGALPAVDRSYRYRVYAARTPCSEATLSPALHVNSRRLLPPQAVTATATASGNTVKWTDLAKTATDYAIFRKKLTDAAWPPTPHATVGGAIRQWDDPDKVDAQYAVRALWAGDRATSNGPLSLPATVQRLPAAKACPVGSVVPELTSVTNVEDPGRSRLQFKYDPAPGAVTRVEYATKATGPWLALHETTATAGPLDVDVGMLMNQKLWLRIAGYDAGKGCVVVSKVQNAYPLPTPPPLPTLPGGAVCKQGLQVRWLDTSAWGTHFQIEYRVGQGAWQATPTQNGAPYGATGEWRLCHASLPAFTNYSYRIRSTVQVKNANAALELVSASLWSNDVDPIKNGNGELSLVNGNLEIPGPDSKQHGPIVGWSRGAWANHLPDYKRAGNQSLGVRFGYYSPDGETVGQVLAVNLEANTIYTFKGWVTGGGDNKGKVPFQIGYITDPTDPKTFKVLANKVHVLGATWVEVPGVSYPVGPNDPAIGQRLMVRLGGKAEGGETDIWFDNLSVSVVSK